MLIEIAKHTFINTDQIVRMVYVTESSLVKASKVTINLTDGSTHVIDENKYLDHLFFSLREQRLSCPD